MSQVVFFGDLHLSDDRPWSNIVSEKIVEFISTCPLNTPSNVAVFVGDMTEQVRLDGNTYAHLLALFRSLRFKKTYIIQGNHDIKKKKKGDGYSSPLRILQRNVFPNIELVNSPRIVVEEKIKILMLPHLTNEEGGVSIYNDLPPLLRDQEYDIVTGHFEDTSVFTKKGETVDIKYLKTKYVCLGHIHNPISSSYVGSLVPNAFSEAGKKRGLRVYENVNGEVVQTFWEISIPIVDFYSITYPDPLPKVKAQIPVWTIFNCRDNAIAQVLYGDIYIRTCVYDVSINFFQFSKYTASSGPQSKTKEVWAKEWIDLNKDNIPENLQKLVLSYLH